MLGSGFGLYAIEAFKRDKKRRKQHVPFSTNLLRHQGKNIVKEFPKATEEQLAIVRTKIKRQQRLDTFKLIISFIIAIILVVGAWYYLESILS